MSRTSTTRRAATLTRGPYGARLMLFMDGVVHLGGYDADTLWELVKG
jgi:hypothetical protein